LDWNLFA
jgi:hypothetical protein